MRDVAQHLQRRIEQRLGDRGRRRSAGPARSRGRRRWRGRSAARWVLIQTWCSSAPLISVSQNARAVALGAGRTRADSQPDARGELPDDQQRPTGTSQGASRVEDAAHRPALTRPPRACCAGMRISLAMISPNGPALRTAPRSRPVRGLQRQQREHQFGEAVAFLQMRVAGQDEGLDARAPCTRCMRAATVSGSPTSAVPAPPRTRPTPAHRLGLISSWSRRPPCSRAHAAAGRPNPSARRRPGPAAIAGVVDMA